MNDSMRVADQRWLYRSDFEGAVLGRDDPPELSDECWGYLEDWEIHARQLIPPPDRAQRATAELIAARVRSATGTHAAERELRRTVERQQATINRLLAFVPTRSGSLQSERLGALISRLTEVARTSFANEDVQVTAEIEDDDDTTAYHRLIVEVPVSDEFDVSAFATASARLDVFLAEAVTATELQAIRLLIEPRIISEP